jgi:alkylation response protein AidB-like acyl-CoA dehydrogenase
MTFELTDTHKMIRDTARKFAQEKLAPDSIRRDENEEFPSAAIQDLADLGFLGMMVSEEWGGIGLDSISYVLALEEIAKVDASCAVIMSVNNSLVCNALNEFGTTYQKEHYLRDLASGRKLGAFALSEPGAGSDASALNTTAVKTGDTYILNGTKNWVTNGSTADVVLVLAVTDKSMGPRGISAFIVDKGTMGFTVARKEKKLGIRSSDTVSLAFIDSPVPVANTLGGEGEGFRLAMKTLEAGRIGIASQAVGIAQGSLEASIKYAKSRRAFGQFLAEMQAIQFKIAEMATNIEAARMLTLKAAYLKDTHQPFGGSSAMAKLMASRVAVESALEAIQIHGGYGYVQEYLVERFLRDAKATEIYEGTSEIQRIIIARSLLK